MRKIPCLMPLFCQCKECQCPNQDKSCCKKTIFAKIYSYILHFRLFPMSIWINRIFCLKSKIQHISARDGTVRFPLGTIVGFLNIIPSLLIIYNDLHHRIRPAPKPLPDCFLCIEICSRVKFMFRSEWKKIPENLRFIWRHTRNIIVIIIVELIEWRTQWTY